MTPKAALERLFTDEQIQADWFAPSFLAQIPIAQVQNIIRSLLAELGNYQEIQSKETDFLVIFERGLIPSNIALDDRGKITGLFFHPPRSKGMSLSEAIEQFKALPGQVSLLVMEDREELIALNADLPLAVGSAFKLAVLNAIQLQIESGKKKWQDLVELQPNWKSLPSGFLQTWPDNSFLTIQTLAALMISQSDNTTTDSLIYLIGIPNIEAITPRNQPFLTTRQAFVLKSNKNSELLNRYRSGNAEERRIVLYEADRQPIPNINDFNSTPSALDVEWFFTARELFSLIEKVADLPLMSINPGVVNANDWEKVAFKGGSEIGVLNLTTWLKAKNGKTYCVVGTWNNDSSLEETRFMSLYGGVIEGLK